MASLARDTKALSLVLETPIEDATSASDKPSFLSSSTLLKKSLLLWYGESPLPQGYLPECLGVP